jgi:hypothetical protein
VSGPKAYHYFAGVHSHPHQQGRAALGPQRVGITAHLVLHAQRGIQRTLGMIFMGNRCAEQRKDAIA